MTAHPTDRALVAAHLGGDQAALAAIYDRYADRLYDTAAAMLRDRDGAADAVQEVFLVAATKLGQLRDPDRLKAWLFAVLRNEVYLRTRRRARDRPTDFSQPGAVEMRAPTDPRAEGGDLERRELAELVRAAAAGLDERDQLVMELNIRQELAGADLAAVVGVSTDQAHVLVHRMRERLSRSLGAFTVARMGRDDCDELHALLEEWDGAFSVLIRKRVARHVDSCVVCDETRSRVSAAALFGAAPVLAAPADLRDRVLAAATHGEAPRHDHRLDADGFPHPPHPGRLLGAARSRLVLGAAVLIVLAGIAGILAFVEGAPDGPTELATAGATTTTTSPATPSGSSPAGSTPAGSTSAGSSPAGSSPAAAPSSSSPAEVSPDPATGSSTSIPAGGSTASTTTVTTTTGPPAVTPGDVVLSTSVVDLGESDQSGRVMLSNPGEEEVSWSVTGGADSPFTWAARSGTLTPGGSTSLQVFLDRTGLPEGAVSSSFSVSGSPSGPSPVQVRARVERPPQVVITTGPRSQSCPSSTGGFVVAEVTDESPIASVELQWSGPGSPGSSTMVQRGPTTWEGSVGPVQTDGTWTYTVVATDSRGNVGSASRPMAVSGCGSGPGGFG